MTNGGIAKIATEIYKVESKGNLIISLSSALKKTEISLIDFEAEGESVENVYFSYEKIKERLQNDLAEMTGERPKEKSASEYEDVLALLVENPKLPSKRDLSKPSSEEVGPKGAPDFSLNKERDLEKGGSEESKPLLMLWLFLAVLVLVGLVTIFWIYSKKKRSR